MGEGMRNKIRKKILSLLLAGILGSRAVWLWTRSGDTEDTGCNDR